MKLISWNINGLRSVINKDKSIKAILTDERPDLLCIQETKCSSIEVIPKHFLDFLTAHEYSYIFSFAKRKGYSGTAVFVKKNLQAEMKNLEEEAAFMKDDEGRQVILEFDKFILINVYVPNSKPDLSRLKERTEKWEPNMRKLVEDLHTKYKKEIILCGDMNVAPEEIDLKNFKTNRGKHGFTNEERRAFQELLKIKMIDTFRDKHPIEQKYSWFSSFAKSRERNVGWRIDMFLVTKKLQNKVIIADIMDKDKWLFSDHIPVILELSF